MRTICLLLLPMFVGLCAVEASSAATLKLPRQWVDHRAGIAIRYPEAWRVTQRPLTPVSDPVQRLVLFSRPPFPSGRLAPGQDQVILQLAEVVPPLATDILQFPARPKHFRLPRLGRMEGFDGNRWAEITFRDHGRGFYAFVGVGEGAIRVEPEILRALDSLTVRSR
jgi:hypothetical protein